MPRESSGTATLDPGGRLSLEVEGGETEVIGRPDASAVRFHADDGHVAVTGRGGAVRLEARHVSRLRVEVPARVVLRLDGRSFFRVSGIEGAVTVDASTGAARIEDIRGDVRVDTGMGAVEVRRIDGRVHVDTGAGPVVVEGVSGNVDVDTGAGPVTLAEVGGDTRVDTGAGRVSGDSFGGKVHVDAGAGRVDLAGLGPGAVHVDTGADGVKLSFARPPRGAVRVDAPLGTVQIELPPESAADLDLRGRSIGVQAEPFAAEEASPRRVRGRLNGGGPQIRVSAGHGVRVAHLAIASAVEAAGGEETAAGEGAGRPEAMELQVLRMLAEGRIGVQDAEDLLDALGGDLRDDPAGPGQDVARAGDEGEDGERQLREGGGTRG